MTQRALLYVMNVSKTSFERYECLKDIFWTLWLLFTNVLTWYVHDSKSSFVRYECLKDVFWTLWMSQRHLLNVMIIIHKCFNMICTWLKELFCTLWKSQRRLLYLMNVSKTSFVSYECLKDVFVRFGCLKDVFCTIWMSQRRLLYLMKVSRTSVSLHFRVCNFCYFFLWSQRESVVLSLFFHGTNSRMTSIFYLRKRLLLYNFYKLTTDTN